MSPPGALAGADRAAERKDGGQILAQSAPERQDDDPAFVTLRAHAERAGMALHRLACGGYVVSRWALSRELPDLAAVGAFLRQMGVRS